MVAASNTKAGYGWVSVALHWIVFVGVGAMFALGFQAEMAGEAGDRARRGALMGLHVSLGVVMLALVVFRVWWTATQPKPDPVPQAKPLMLLSSWTHRLLIAGLLVLVISGPLIVWSGGRAINVFDLISLPSPFGARNETLREAAGLAHGIGRFMLFVLVPLHILGAAKHLVFDQGGQTLRMFRIASKS
jgi:cytochrome b561